MWEGGSSKLSCCVSSSSLLHYFFFFPSVIFVLLLMLSGCISPLKSSSSFSYGTALYLQFAYLSQCSKGQSCYHRPYLLPAVISQNWGLFNSRCIIGCQKYLWTLKNAFMSLSLVLMNIKRKQFLCASLLHYHPFYVPCSLIAPNWYPGNRRGFITCCVITRRWYFTVII